jgi:hypothetical protein
VSSDVNFQMCLLVEALVTVRHVALVTLPWLLADFGFLNLEGVSTGRQPERRRFGETDLGGLLWLC